MGILLYAISSICSFISLVCYIMTIIKMFNQDKAVPAIISLLTFPCGIGFLIALIMGWLNTEQWNNKNVMTAWTTALIGGIVAAALGGYLAGG